MIERLELIHIGNISIIVFSLETLLDQKKKTIILDFEFKDKEISNILYNMELHPIERVSKTVILRPTKHKKTPQKGISREIS